MTYEQFITELHKYWDLRDRGLKKQANNFLSGFTKRFKEEVSDIDADDIFYQFCKEYIDEMKFPGDNNPRRHLPFQLTELLGGYLNRECGNNKMPQMRWQYEIFGEGYNIHDYNTYHILERAYTHEECDQQTVNHYFDMQVGILWEGQHHFPEGCCITQEEFEDAVCTANKILSEKSVDLKLKAEFEYYVKLYHIYFEWQKNGQNGDFYELCKNAGIEFEALPAFYFNN